MATRYWRGGTGSWTGANAANWAASADACTFTASRSTTVLTVTAVSSGAIAVGMTVWHTTNTAIGTITAFGTGTGGVGTYTMSASSTLTSRTMSSATIGATAPTSADPVFFDANSNVGTAAFTVTTSTGAACGGMSVSGLDGAMTWAGTTAMTIAGGLLLPVSNFTRTYTGALTFSDTGNITANGVALDSALTFNGALQTFTLGSALTTIKTITFTQGSIALDSFTLTGLSFASSNTNTRSINFGTGKISVTGTTGTVWNMADWTNFTLSGTPNVEKLNSGGTVSHGPAGLLDYTKTINIQGLASATYLGQFRNFQAGGVVTLTASFTVYGNFTIDAGATFSGSFSVSLRGGEFGSPATQQFVTTNGVTLYGLVNNSAAIVILASDVITTSGFQAKFDTAGFNVNTDTLSIYAGSLLNNSTLTARVVDAFSGVTPGNSTIILTGNANVRLSSVGNVTTAVLNDVYVASNQADTTTVISGNLSFNRFYNQSTVAHTIEFFLDSETGGQQYYFANFDASGTASAQLTLKALDGGSIPTLTQTTGTVNLNYATIMAITATGGATWNAFTSNGNINGGGNTGWNFIAPVVTNTGNFFAIFKRR